MLGSFRFCTANSSPARIIAVLALLLTVIAGAVSQTANAQADQSLKFAFWGDPAELDAYQAVATQYEATHPGTTIEVDYTPGQSDYYKKIATDFAASDPPDIFLTNYRNFGQYAAAGSLASVQSYLDASTTIGQVDYYEISMDAFRYQNGPVVCMPQNISSLVAYYNVDMFNANGIALPTVGWTWDEFITAAQALTQDTDNDGTVDQFGVVVEPSMYRMSSFIWGANGQIVDNIDNPTKLLIDSPEAQAGIEDFLSLGVMGYNVVPPEAEVAAVDDQTRFMNGGAGIFLQSRRPVPTLREIEGFTWDVTSLPVIDQPSTVLHSDAFCIAAATADKDLAWSFVEFATGAEGQTILAQTGRTVPSMISILESPVFLAPIAAGAMSSPSAGTAVAGTPTAAEVLPPANNQVYLDNVAVMNRLPSTATWGEVEDEFNAVFGRGFYEPVDVAAGTAAVVAAADPIIARGNADE